MNLRRIKKLLLRIKKNANMLNIFIHLSELGLLNWIPDIVYLKIKLGFGN